MTPNPILAYSPYITQESDIENNIKKTIDTIILPQLNVMSELLIKINNLVAILIYIVCVPILTLVVIMYVKLCTSKE